MAAEAHKVKISVEKEKLVRSDAVDLQNDHFIGSVTTADWNTSVELQEESLTTSETYLPLTLPI